MAYCESWTVTDVDRKANWLNIKYKVDGAEEEEAFTLMNSLLSQNGINPNNIGVKTELRVQGKGITKIQSSNMIKRIQIIR